MVSWRDATFPETTGKVLNMMGWREGKQDSESPNYSYLPLPAKVTDGASYTEILTAGSVVQEAEENQPLYYFAPFGR